MKIYKKSGVVFIFVLLLLSVAGISSGYAQENQNVVRAVLFYSPTCPHCHKVMTEDLPPLHDQYGDQLEILEVNVTTSSGQKLFQQAINDFSVPDDRLGVPALVVGGSYLVGSVEIPQSFPGIIEDGLATNGIDWPQITGLTDYINKNGLTSVEKISMSQRFLQDPVGNSFSTLVLLGMVASVIYIFWSYMKNSIGYGPWPRWILPVLIVVGIAVSSYLSYVEFTNDQVVCGPVGDCNAVQSTTYSQLFGVLPVAVLGLVGYLGMGAAWIGFTRITGRRQHTSAQVLWWLALGGTLFSIYLTYLEPFVIGATCIWCLTSATSVTLILWASSPLLLEQPKKSKRKKATRKARASQVR
jgi:uncharacterized membrane protein